MVAGDTEQPASGGAISNRSQSGSPAAAPTPSAKPDKQAANAAVEKMAQQLDTLSEPASKASSAEHPLEGKGSRDVFRQMSGVQKKALEILGKEAYEGITEQWMTVMNKRTGAGGGDETDGYSQPPNPLVPTGMIGKTLVQVAGGLNHAIICGDAGEVLAMGENKSGQLGVVEESSATADKAKTFLEAAFGDKDADDQDQDASSGPPTQRIVYSTTAVVKAMMGRRVFHVSCGSSFSAALTDAGTTVTR